MVGAFQTADAQVGGGVLYGQVLRYLHAEIGPALVDPTPGTGSGHLFAAGCAITELVGWMAHDAGGDDRARAHFDRAFRLASAADHLPLAANVCASMAHLAGQLGEPGEAIRIAGAGLDRARPTGLRRLAARLQAMRARGLAMQGRRRECSANLHAAAASLEAADDETTPAWVAPFDAGSLAAETALCLAELGELAEAERHARQVIVLRPPARARSRAFGQLTLARVLLAAGRVEEAAAQGSEVCAVLPVLSSARVTQRCDRLAAALEPHRQVRAVADFLGTLATTLSTDGSAARRRPGWPV